MVTSYQLPNRCPTTLRTRCIAALSIAHEPPTFLHYRHFSFLYPSFILHLRITLFPPLSFPPVRILLFVVPFFLPSSYLTYLFPLPHFCLLFSFLSPLLPKLLIFLLQRTYIRSLYDCHPSLTHNSFSHFPLRLSFISLPKLSFAFPVFAFLPYNVSSFLLPPPPSPHSSLTYLAFPSFLPYPSFTFRT